MGGNCGKRATSSRQLVGCSVDLEHVGHMRDEVALFPQFPPIDRHARHHAIRGIYPASSRREARPATARKLAQGVHRTRIGQVKFAHLLDGKRRGHAGHPGGHGKVSDEVKAKTFGIGTEHVERRVWDQDGAHAAPGSSIDYPAGRIELTIR